MKEPLRQKALLVVGLAIAAALLIAGSVRRYEVQPVESAKPSESAMPTPAFGAPSFPGAPGFPPAPSPPSPKVTSKTVGDPTLVVNATFGGIARRGTDLFFTIDPSKAGGKQACPT